jgi:hypothetical protein
LKLGNFCEAQADSMAVSLCTGWTLYTRPHTVGAFCYVLVRDREETCSSKMLAKNF